MVANAFSSSCFVIVAAGGHPPELASVRVSCCVLALTWLTPAEQQLDLQGRSLLAVLHEFTGEPGSRCG